MTVTAEAKEAGEARRGHLAALAREVQARGLTCRLLGADESVLRVVNVGTGRNVMVLATASNASGQPGWTYLWSGGGQADAAAPGEAADQIAAGLT